MKSTKDAGKIAWSRLTQGVTSLWRPIIGDIGFLFMLGFVGGAIGRKIEALLIAAGASIARQSQGMDAVRIASSDSSILWQALGLHLVFVLVVYVLFCVFGVIGWRWAAKRDDKLPLSTYIARFFGFHACLIPFTILIDVLGFWSEYQGMAIEGSLMANILLVIYSALTIFLVCLSLIGSVKIYHYPVCDALRESLASLCAKKSWTALGGVLGGVMIINAVIALVSILDPGLAIVIGAGLLFPYLSFVRLVAMEVFS